MSSPKTERLLRLAIVLLTVTFVFVIANTLREKRILAVGETVPDFSITADNGRTFTPENFGGKLLVVNFWASWCPPCVDETPSLSRFAEMTAPAGVVVLAISRDNDEKAYRDFLARFHPTFLTARDPKAAIQFDFGTRQIPETYVINPQGKLLRKYINSQRWDSEGMLSEIRSLL
jgi:cytochrome c biogenesis protein CcmG, thiol:disulfide interchange protein DsbE